MYSYKDIWKVSAPIMLGLLAQNIVQFTDTFFLGLVGTVEQGASGLAGIYYIAFFTICFGFSIGGQIMISRRNGAKDYKRIGGIVLQGVIFLEVIALVLIALSMLGIEYLMPKFISSPEVFAAMESYMIWRIIGLVFSAFNVMFRAFYVGIARTKVLTVNAIIMATVNFVFDYLLIFGKFGFPEMGIAGASIAAVIAELASVAFFAVYTYKTVDLQKYGFTKMKFNFGIIRSILKISSFTMVQYMISMSTWFLFFVAMEKHSVEALAITNIVRSFYMLFFIPMNAFGTSANTLVGNTMGAGNISNVIPLIKRICILSVSVIVVVAAVTALFPEFFISFIAPEDTPSLIELSKMPLLIVVAALPICSLGTVVFNAISGTGNTRDALILEMITLAVYIFYLVFVAFDTSVSVAICWMIEYVYWGGLFVLSILYLRYARWQTKVI